ncbi:histidine kinase [Leucobacter allii]|uniref:sensor histidine kinase n=1 Tax=Leucobacter allii TaxID=2932247 RepID=UPI001FD1150F|nr:histidine kinase [Leucobacter allii]UOR03290.1 histidine kinase [Leucobacter allii]
MSGIDRAGGAPFPQAPPVTAEVRLPRPPGVIRRAFAAHPRAVDVSIVACYAFGVLCGMLLDAAGAAGRRITTDGAVDPDGWIALPAYLAWPWWPFAVLGLAAVGAALLLRRRFPLIGLVVTVAVCFWANDAVSLATGVALMFMLYAVPVYRSVPAAWAGYAIAVLGAALAYAGVASGTFAGSPSGLFASDVRASGTGDLIALTTMTAIWYLAIVMLGINLGNRRRYLAAIIDRAHQLARERDQLAQLAVAEERSRIAREMHDVVAHSVSVMIALSEGAARAAEQAPEAAADAMRRSAETGRTALAEMRRLLGALHAPDDEAALVPQPGVDELPALIEGFVEAGLDAQLRVRGADAGDRGQDLAVYRIVQEGLTNVLRHAGIGARAEVNVSRGPLGTEVTVRDHGRVPGAPAPVSGVGSGRGLAGLAERVRVFGGRIESGPSDGGWRLWAELPTDASARDRAGGTGGGTVNREIGAVAGDLAFRMDEDDGGRRAR